MDIFTHYLDLIELAQTPDNRLINRVRILLKPKGWGRLNPESHRPWHEKIWFRYGKITSAVIDPLKVESAPDVLYRIPGGFLVLWIELVAVTYSLLNAAKTAGFDLPQPTVPTTEAALFEVFFWTIIILLAPAHYSRLYRFLTSERHSRLYRILFFLGLLTAFWVVFLFPGMFLERLLPDVARTTGNLRGTDVLLSGFVGFFIFIPALAYLWFLSIDLILWAVFVLTGTWIYFIMFHESHPIRQIQRLVFEEIPRRNCPKEKWQLTGLAEEELEAIRAWAEANREGTEKRLLPTIIFFSLVQLFGWNAMVNTEIGQRLIGLWNQMLSLMATTSFWGVLMAVLVGVLLVFFLIPFVAIGKLFMNILPQSLIIEACIVAKHQKQRMRPPAPDKEEPVPARFWDRLAFVFGYERRT